MRSFLLLALLLAFLAPAAAPLPSPGGTVEAACRD
jgi:hypothetical protein